MSFIQNKENPTLDDIDKSLVTALQRDISDAENYQDTVILPTVKERYEIYYADKDYYARKLPRLSKVSSLVSTDVTDTIEWALPSLIKVFTGGDEVVTVQGSSEEDDRNAEIMQQLLVYQLQRQNRFFPILYNWMKDALITGMGIIKCYWDRKEDYQLLEQSMNMRAFQELTQQNVEIQSVEGPDMFGIVRVQYLSPYYVKNAPVIENILVSELLYSSDAKSLDEANFVAHKKKVTMSYLREREQQGIYANVDQITPKPKTGIMNDDQVEQVIGDNYQGTSQEADDARAEVTLYECYTKLDWNNDGVLEDMIITIVDDVILRVEPNYMGRHPFFAISPTKDPHRIWVKRSYAELIGELQDLKVALTRQIVQNIALTNDPKMILAEDAINIDDYVKGRAVIRKKANHPMQDVAMSMPVNQLSPYTYQFLEYIESQKENRTGITRYNQGLDANTLNKMIDITTPVPMADGTWKVMGDIEDGDVIVGQNGKPTRVIKAHKIHYPERAYNITFSNGDVIKAGGEHLWTIFGYHRVRQTINTDKIYDLFNKSKQPIFVDRVYHPDNQGDIELPLDPYFLGLYLGDGCLHTSRITTEDEEVRDYCKEWAEKQGGELVEASSQHAGKATTYEFKKTGLREILRELKIARDSRYDDMKDNQKHIPEIYFKASYEQRLALLRGLMDTDGCHHSGALCIFTQKEGQLVEDIIRLIQSFGWNVSKHVTNPGKLAKPGATYYNVHISALDNPFRLSRKASKFKPTKRMVDKVKIQNIEECPVVLMRCLTVDAPDGQFCVGKHYTVTHNTATGISQIMGASTQRLELIARMFAETGVYELFRFMIGLNQKFIDQNTVIRLTNKELAISPDDLQGNFDLIVNAGISIASKESTQLMLQSMLTALMQVRAAGIPIVTPDNIYNLFKKWIEAAGFKNYADYITDPAVVQQRMATEYQLKMQVLASLPPQAAQLYMQTGVLPPEILMSLPPEIQALFDSGSATRTMWGGVGTGQNGIGVQETASAGYGQSGPSPAGGNPSSGMVGGLSRTDNRQPQNVPRERGNGPPKQAGGVGGF